MAKKISDEELLNALLKWPESTDAELGKLVGLTRVQISRRKGELRFQKLLKDEISKSADALNLARLKAIQIVLKILESPDERTALRAAQLIFEHSSKSVPGESPEHVAKSEMFSRVSALLSL